MDVSKNVKHAYFGLVVMAFIIGIAACSDSTDSSDTGTLRLTMVDAPLPIQGVEAIDIIFSSVLVHQTSSAEMGDANWIVLMDDQLPVEDRTFNLLELINGNFAVVGEVDLEDGHYSQIRIIIESATITVDGVTSDLFIMSGEQFGVKLVKAFTIEPNTITELMVDFDAGQSVWESPLGSGSYRLQPTLRVEAIIISGSISGTVTPLKIDAMVIAYETGTDVVVTSTYVDTTDGSYVLIPLVEGTYDLEAVAAGYDSLSESGVGVTAQSDNSGHDFVLPLTGGGL